MSTERDYILQAIHDTEAHGRDARYYREQLAGIDYGCGRTNIDHETGIRFGVISQHDISQAWADSSEADYGEPTCPKCGNAAVDSARVNNDIDNSGERWPQLYSHGCCDYACKSCEVYLDSSDVFGEEPIGFTYEAESYYRMASCLDSDVMVLKSPYFTHAVFCSPCVPGAGDLNHADPAGVRTYCVGHDWFEEGQAPYPVYSVATGELVNP